MGRMERRDASCTLEDTPCSTRTATKRKSASAKLAHAKRQRMATTHRESDSADDMEEAYDTPLTRPDIPKIVDAVLSNFSKEGASSKDGSQDDSQGDPYLVDLHEPFQ